MKAPLHVGDDGLTLGRLHVPLPFPGAYQVLFFALLGTLVIYPLLGGATLLRSLADFMTATMLMFGALASSTNRRQLIVTMVLASLGVLASVLLAPRSDEGLIAARLYAAGFLGYVVYMILHDVVIANRRVNAALIYGALCAYLLFALLFANLYAALHALQPEAFAGLDPASDEAVIGSYTYFSFVTLTTLGYGDIVPVAPFARAVAYTEAVGGQIYLTVIVARVVALYILDVRQD